MYSLKRFAVFSWSWNYPLMRSLLLCALCNKNTTEVYICDGSIIGKCTHKVFNEDGLVSYEPLLRWVHYGYHSNNDHN